MSKNMFILTVCAISFICSCTDTICGDETMKSEPIESHYVVWTVWQSIRFKPTKV